MKKIEKNESLESLEILDRIDMDIEELAFQLTAYEKWGVIDYVGGVADLVISEYLEMAERSEVISMYNNYLYENEYYDDVIYSNDEYFFKEYFTDPMEAVRASYYGRYNYNDDYVKFNVYGNLDSYNDYILVDEIKRDTDFTKWIFENDAAFEELRENKSIITQKALELVKAGY